MSAKVSPGEKSYKSEPAGSLSSAGAARAAALFPAVWIFEISRLATHGDKLDLGRRPGKARPTAHALGRVAPRLARDRAFDRRVRRLRDPRGVQPELFQDVGRLALGQELVGQCNGPHPAGQSVRGKCLEHSATKPSTADVIFDCHHDRMTLRPIHDSRIDGLHPARVDHGDLDALPSQAFARSFATSTIPPTPKMSRSRPFANSSQPPTRHCSTV